MDKPLDPLLHLREGAEVGHLDNTGLDVVPDGKPLGDRLPRVGGQLLEAQREALLLLVDAQHLDLDILALAQHFGGVLDLCPGEVGDVDEAVYPLLEAHKRPEISEIADPPLDQLADRVALFDGLPGVGLGLLDPERDSTVVLFDVEHDGLDDLPDGDDLGGVAYALVPAHLAHVYEPLDALLELHEGPVVGYGDHLACHPAVDGVLGLHLVPGVGLQLLVAEADPLALHVELEHHDFDLVPDGEYLRGVTDPAPGHIGDMEQPVDTAQIDEGPVVGEVLEDAFHLEALLEDFHRPVLGLLPLLLQQHPPGQHYVAALAVELDDFHLELLADECLKVSYGAQVDLAAWQKRPQPHIDGQPALDAREDAALHGGPIIEGLVQIVPDQYPVGLLLRKHDHPVGVFRALQEDVDCVAYFEVASPVGELVEWNEPFGLVSHIHQDRIALNLHDVARENLALLDVLKGLFVELFHGGLAGLRWGVGGRRLPACGVLDLGSHCLFAHLALRYHACQPLPP